MPESAKGKEKVYTTFFTLSIKRPAVDVLAHLQPISTNVHTYGETFTHPLEVFGAEGSFDDGANTVGFVIRNNQAEWNNTIEKLTAAGIDAEGAQG